MTAASLPTIVPRDLLPEAGMSEVQAPDALVGAWRLVSWENRAADGQVTTPWGPTPPALCRPGPLLGHHLAAGPGWVRRR